jgi:hypothetical protein
MSFLSEFISAFRCPEQHDANSSKLQFDNVKYLQSGLTVHVRWPGQTSRAFGLALIFLFLFPSREKERNVVLINVSYFLLLVQKKVPKKSTPATIYSRCRTP